MEAHAQGERRRRRGVLGIGWRQPRATRDGLTGLMTAPAFQAVASHALGHAARVGEPSVLVCCALAPSPGESELARSRRLKEAARRLVEATRGEDVLGRTGPLELCALLPGTDEDDAGLVAERLAALEVAVGWAGGAPVLGDVNALLEGARAEATRFLKLTE